MMSARDDQEADEVQPLRDPVASSEQDSIQETQESKVLQYTVNENPPIHLSLLFGLQQALFSMARSLTVSILVAELVCAGSDDVIRTELLCSTLFMSGMCTFLQCTIGIRLPLYQGPSATYVVPLLALATLDTWKCPAFHSQGGSFNTSDGWTGDEGNFTSSLLEYRENIIIPKLQLLAGSLMIAGTVHTLIGATGLVGMVLQFIGPITVVPTLILICLFMIKTVIKFISTQWGVGILTAGIAIILSLYLGKYSVLIPAWNRNRGFYFLRSSLHKVFSILISMTIGWITSYILTESGYLSDDPQDHQFLARTDARSKVISETAWFFIPYPGQFGAPKLNIAVIVNFIICTLLSVIDSIGDYYACARVCLEPPPPSSSVNRGIFVEGVATVLSGAVGIGHSTSTLGGNIGAIWLTRVASRRVFQIVGLIYMFFGVIGKIGAFFICIPYSVLGGIQLTNFGILVGIMMSNLIHVDLNLTRNTSIIGLSLTVGLMIPYWVKLNPHGISTGSEETDDIIMALLSNPSVAGGALACFLDNTIPGTRKQRGLIEWQADESDEVAESDSNKKTSTSIYDLPYLPDLIRNSNFARYVPILPMYRFNMRCGNCMSRQRKVI